MVSPYGFSIIRMIAIRLRNHDPLISRCSCCVIEIQNALFPNRHTRTLSWETYERTPVAEPQPEEETFTLEENISTPSFQNTHTLHATSSAGPLAEQVGPFLVNSENLHSQVWAEFPLWIVCLLKRHSSCQRCLGQSASQRNCPLSPLPPDSLSLPLSCLMFQAVVCLLISSCDSEIPSLDHVPSSIAFPSWVLFSSPACHCALYAQ